MVRQPKIKVLHITPSGQIGGRERQIFLLMKELVKYRHEVQNDIAFIRPDGPFYEQCLALPIQTYSTDLNAWHPGYFRFYFKLFKDYDVINFWGIDHYLFTISLLHDNVKVFTLTGPRLVIRKTMWGGMTDILKVLTVRKNIIGSGPGRSSAIQKINGIKSGILRVVRKELFIRFLNKCQKIITPSDYMRSIAMSEYGIESGKIKVISNFVDYEDIVLTKDKMTVKSELSIKPSTFLVGVASRFDTRKRLDRIVQAMAQLPENLDVQAIILGNGEGEERRRLLDEIKRTGMQERIKLPGEKLDIYNYIHAMDLFVLPSDREGFGLVLLEALYLKVPTVVFADGGGGLEIIKDGQTGFVVRSVEGLADLIRSFVSHREELNTMTENGYQHVTKCFTASHAVMYNEVTENCLIN